LARPEYVFDVPSVPTSSEWWMPPDSIDAEVAGVKPSKAKKPVNKLEKRNSLKMLSPYKMI
jgi:hypothetical protein